MENKPPVYPRYPSGAPYAPQEKRHLYPSPEGFPPPGDRKRRRRRRLKPGVKRFFGLVTLVVLLLIFKPWKWFHKDAVAVVDEIVEPPTPLNHILNNAHSDLPEAARFDRVVQRFIQKWDITGASLAIMKDGNLIYAKGYGWADKEDGDSMEVRHIMRIASVSKLITATAVMKLWERGELGLNDLVFGEEGILNDPQFCGFTDKKLTKVTVEHLLRHRAGFTMRAGDPMFNWQLIETGLGKKPPYTMDDYVEYAVKMGIRYQPGTRTDYSNLGYVVLSKVIEKVTGMPYETYVQDSILAPAGCYDMHIGRNRHEDKFPNEVRYYETTEAELFPACDTIGGMVLKSHGANDVYGLTGAGGWVASPTELLKFVAAIDGDPSKPDILKLATVRKMTEDRQDVLPIGWMHTTGDGTWSRTGSMAGTNALLRRQANGYTWVFLTNTSSWKGARFQRYISGMLRDAFDRVDEWPEKDLFEADSLMNDVVPE